MGNFHCDAALITLGSSLGSDQPQLAMPNRSVRGDNNILEFRIERNTRS
jgi:hypothetical protein